MRLMGFFAILFLNALFAGEILTTNDFAVIEKEAEKLDKDSFVLFDVDATLIVPNDDILKPKCKALFKELIASYTDRELFREIRMKAPHTLVDDRSIGLVKKLQQNHIPVIAFTAARAKVRGVEQLGVWRVEELKRYGFDFSGAFPNCNFLEFPKYVDQKFFPLFMSGVLYASLHPKGDILTLFLQKMKFEPNKVIFVDDELQQVQSVIEALDELDIPCLGIHYTLANEAPCNISLELARFQIDYFVEHDIWLSDKAAKELFEKNN